jgi:hypothetical protein
MGLATFWRGVASWMMQQVPWNGVRVMHWAELNGDGCTNLYFSENNVESPGHGIASRTFCAMLEEALSDAGRNECIGSGARWG